MSVRDCYLDWMTQSQDLKPAIARSRVALGLLYAGVLASVMIGSALIASMGGELPSDDPTAGEQSRWAWGNGLALTGFVLTLLCAALLFAFRKRLGLRLSTAAGVVLAGGLLAGFLYFLTWVIVIAF
jgi:hypothetical protein